jgi:putative transposase
MPFAKLMVHVVWGTKRREPFLTSDVKSKLIAHIIENARSKKIFIDSINGHLDHIHCLLGLNADMTLIKAIQLIKGESAYWVNKNKLTLRKFEWADEYYAVSVSESHLKVLRHYIQIQEEHHKKVTYDQEYKEFLNDEGFGINPTRL